ncbi:MAG: T9SS type A sorting domain-containing protein [Ignavibacteriaceae bacterium]
MMKIIPLIMASLFCELIFAQISFYPTYNLSNTPNTMSDSHSVYFESGGYYYTVWVDEGKILFIRSNDLGQSWSEKQILISSNNVCGLPTIKSDYNYVYVLCHQYSGDYEILFLSSTDFGQTWGPLQGISGMDSGSLAPQLAVSGSNLFVVWEQKTSLFNNISEINFVKSSDRGLSWSDTTNLSNSQSLHSTGTQIANSGFNLYCSWLESTSSTESDIYFSKSTDGGNIWSDPVNLTNDASFQNEVYMILNGNSELYIAYVDGTSLSDIYLIKSTDSGQTWSVPVNMTNNPGKSSNPCISIFDNYLYFIWSDNSHTSPLFDSSDVFFKWSSDNGSTWQDSLNLSDNSSNSLRPRICYDLNGPLPAPWLDITVFWYDFAEGNSEIFAKNGNHNIVTTEQFCEVPFSFSLEQNYPNPFNPSTKIKFTISDFGFVILKVFDVLGNEVATLVNEEKSAGEYEVEFNRKNLPSGIYFYRIQSGSFVDTKKMILLK